MTKFLTSLCVFCIVIAVAVPSAAMMKPTIVPAGTAKWAPLAGMSGATVAVLYGTPSKAGSGVFVELLKVSKDITFPIHYHPTDELVTVLNGTLIFNVGDKVNWSTAKTLTAGGFVGIPAGVHHYGTLKAGSVIEISGLAPDTLIVVKQPKTSM
jgi:quercetin dioxygenase-like cupin family protein